MHEPMKSGSRFHKIERIEIRIRFSNVIHRPQLVIRIFFFFREVDNFFFKLNTLVRLKMCCDQSCCDSSYSTIETTLIGFNRRKWIKFNILFRIDSTVQNYRIYHRCADRVSFSNNLHAFQYTLHHITLHYITLHETVSWNLS